MKFISVPKGIPARIVDFTERTILKVVYSSLLEKAENYIFEGPKKKEEKKDESPKAN